jgi:electron transfer flavoprotein alpha subunit
VSKVLVFCEVQEGAIRKGSRQALTAARKIQGAEVEALIIDKEAASIAGSKLGGYGVKRAHAVNYDGAYSSAVWAAAAQQAAGGGDCIVLASDTAIAKDFAPRLGARLNCPQVSDVIDLSGSVGALEITRPIYAGKAFEKLKTASKTVVATLRPNAFPDEPSTNGSSGPEVATLAATEPPANQKTVVREVLKPQSTEVELTEADVIVSGGIGVGGPDGFEFLRPLQKELGAALGASRAAVLAGWIPQSHQVGQTGKTVSPQLYVACGISGAIQHRAGMSSSKVIVAINKDPQAPIFEIADYGIAADLFKVVPPFIEAVKKIKSN